MDIHEGRPHHLVISPVHVGLNLDVTDLFVGVGDLLERRFPAAQLSDEKWHEQSHGE